MNTGIKTALLFLFAGCVHSHRLGVLSAGISRSGVLALFSLLGLVAQAQPTVSSVFASQQLGTRTVAVTPGPTPSRSSFLGKTIKL